MKTGTRVELHPALDLWMRGCRFGTVIRVLKNGRVDVKLDRTGRVVRLSPANVTELVIANAYGTWGTK